MASNTIKVILAGDAKGLTSSLQTASSKISAFGAAATVALGALAMKSVQSASTLNESVNAVNVTFGSAAGGINQLGEEAAQSLGLSTVAFNELAVRFSSFATTVAGEGGDVVAVMDELTTRAADFASVMNIDVAEASRVFQSGLAGETEPLKRYGIDLSAAAVQQYALANGIAKTSEVMTEQQKIEARYGLLMASTDKTAGDFENTSDSLANTQRRLTAEWGNATAAMGEGFLPVVEKIANVSVDLLERFNQLPTVVRSGALAFGLLGAVLLMVIPRIVAFKASMVQANITMASTIATTKATAASFATMALTSTAGLLGLSAAVVAVTSRVVGLDEAISDASEGGVTLVGAFKSELGDGGWFEPIAEGIATVSSALSGGENEWQVASRLVADYDANLAALVADGEHEEAAELVKELTSQLEAEGGSAEDLIDVLPQYAAALDGTTTATAKAGATTQELSGKVQELIDKFTILRRGFLDQREATRAYEAALDDADKALAENGKTLNESTESGRKNAAALDAVASSGNDVTTSLVKQGAPLDKVMGQYREMRKDLIAQAVQFGMTKKEAETYANQILRTPKQVRTDAKFVADKQGVLDYQKLLGTIGTMVLTPEVILHSTTSGVAGRSGDQRAYGGYISGPGGPRDDLIPAWLSNGEYVIQASAVRGLGIGFLDSLNRGRVPGFASGGSASGMTAKERAERAAEQMRAYNRAVMDRLNELVSAAKDQLKELKGQRKDYAKGVSSGLMSMSLGGTMAEGKDNDARSLLGRYRQQARRMKQFIGQLNRLYKKGLNRTLLSEIMEMGSDEGGTMARILLSDATLLGQFNKVYRGADNAADRFGNKMGNRYYGDRIAKAERQVERAEDRRARARNQIQDQYVVNINVAGAVLSDRELSKVLTPTIREELRKHDRKNGKKKRN